VIATAHEGAAAFMAEAHGQLTGRPAVCLGTRAVGAANLAIGIHTARQDSTPLFRVVGQVERPLRGREAFQEIDQVGTIGGLAKWRPNRTTADEVRRRDGARRCGRARRPARPVLLSLSEDLLDEPLPDDARLELARTPTRGRRRGDPAVVELLASARRPVILAGAGVLRARTSTELTRFAELLQVPVIATWRRPDVVSNDHSCTSAMAGLGAPASCVSGWTPRTRCSSSARGCTRSRATATPCPATGCRGRTSTSSRAARGLPAPSITVTADAKAFLKAPTNGSGSGRPRRRDGCATRQANNAEDRARGKRIDGRRRPVGRSRACHPGRIVTTLRGVLPDDAILTTDAATSRAWAGAASRFRRPGHLHRLRRPGSMGYGLPAAIAAALVHRDRPVVALVGDGGLA
jgi:acetolactate synthase-1/2/3 large subunit